jgi:hypothetical protein
MASHNAAHRVPGLSDGMGNRGNVTTGAISELVVAVDLTRKGFEVFRAVDPSASCDLLALKDGVVVRVEVRTGTRAINGRVSFAPHNLGPHRQDCVAVVLAGDEIVYVPPFE